MNTEFWELIFGPHGVTAGAVFGVVYFARQAAIERAKHDVTRDEQTEYLKLQARHNQAVNENIEYVNAYIRKREAAGATKFREDD